jgi:uncharacterized protein RhaS with RHS repeats
LNLYRYAPNPISWVDPWGLTPEGYTFDLPGNPLDLITDGWEDVTHAAKRVNTSMLDIRNPETGQLIEFHPGKAGETGWGGVDHYHVHNPNATSKGDHYLNNEGKPVPKGSDASHIKPNQPGYEAGRAGNTGGC